MTAEWNPRYLAYCAAHGCADPAATLERFPGGSFTLWCEERWAEWDRARSPEYKRWGRIRTGQEQQAFTAWLLSTVRGDSCPLCGARNDPARLNCERCSAVLCDDDRCTQCGSRLREDQHLSEPCERCGHVLERDYDRERWAQERTELEQVFGSDELPF